MFLLAPTTHRIVHALESLPRARRNVIWLGAGVCKEERVVCCRTLHQPFSSRNRLLQLVNSSAGTRQLMMRQPARTGANTAGVEHRAVAADDESCAADSRQTSPTTPGFSVFQTRTINNNTAHAREKMPACPEEGQPPLVAHTLISGGLFRCHAADRPGAASCHHGPPPPRAADEAAAAAEAAIQPPATNKGAQQ